MGEPKGKFGGTNILAPYRVELILSDLTNNHAFHSVSSDPTNYSNKKIFPLALQYLDLKNRVSNNLDLIFFFFFLWPYLWHMDIPGPGVESELQLRPTPQQQQHRNQAVSVTYATACGNIRSLTHWVRPGIELTSSWMLCGVLTRRAKMGIPQIILILTKILMTLQKNKTQDCWYLV